MDFSCFSSPDPAAHNATVVFDFDDDERNLWSRRSLDVPLPPCSSPTSSSVPPDSRCSVCVDRIVYAVCRNLTHSAKVTMEAVTGHVKISKSGCPKLLSDDAAQWPLPVVIMLILTLIFIIIVGIYKCRSHCNNRDLRGANMAAEEKDTAPNSARSARSESGTQTQIQTHDENQSCDLTYITVHQEGL